MSAPAALLVVAAGGALGAMARYGVSLALSGAARWGLPWATLTVNTAGSLLAGFLFVILNSGPSTPRLLLMVGFLGAFTTFSAFSVETLALINAGASRVALLNLLLNPVLSLLACLLGMLLGRALSG